MIRATLTKKRPRGTKKSVAAKKPKGRSAVYVRDFDFIQRTVKRSYPALGKKSIDWAAICSAQRGAFLAVADDEAHLINVHRLLATLQDTHTGIAKAKIEVHVPSFDGSYGGGGLWIATDPGLGRILLRALSPGHRLAKQLPRGSELLAVDGRPARLVLEDRRRHLREWHGWSSEHFLDARLSMSFFDFGERQRVAADFLDPDGKVVRVQVPRYGPGGRGVDRRGWTLPDGLVARGLAVATRIDDSIGYVRILGSMNSATQKAFFSAMDSIRGVKGILLDCRGMGGGGDRAAWAMAGRFFARRTPNGSSRALVPTGKWQFTGPVVMLQDEREVSSAETFTWAMTETGRVVSVGRPTGGATIIPRVFRLPSGLASFRMGTHDRKTPIRAVQPEGVGTQPDIFVPYEAALLRRTADPIRWIGEDVLRQLVTGADRKTFVLAVHGWLNAAVPAPKSKQSSELIGYLSGDYVADCIASALAISGVGNPMPDFVTTEARLRRLAKLAKALGQSELAQRATAAARSWEAEIAAQRAYEQLGRYAGDAQHPETRAFLADHGETRYGKALRAVLR